MRALLALAALLAAAAADRRIPCVRGNVCRVPDASLRFFILADWGGLPIWPYETYAEKTVAETMGTLALTQKTHFQLALGDNFYFFGVKDEFDERFKETFTDVFGKHQGLATPWYVLAGNHDHYGNASAQVAYTAQSDRWVMPSLNYTVRYALSDGSRVDVVMIDTIVLCGNTRNLSFASALEYFRSESFEPTGPRDPLAAEAQWAWLEGELASSRADYLFVAGHYPVWSIAEHGPTPLLVKRLRPLLIKYQASGYFSGHDHTLQHINESSGGGDVHYVVSGAGAYIDDSQSHRDAVPKSSVTFHYPPSKGFWGKLGLTRGGFVYASANRTAAEFQFLRGDGEELHRFAIPPRSL